MSPGTEQILTDPYNHRNIAEWLALNYVAPDLEFIGHVLPGPLKVVLSSRCMVFLALVILLISLAEPM